MYFGSELIRYLMVSYTIHTKSFEGTAFHVFITAIIYLKHDTECNNLDKKAPEHYKTFTKYRERKTVPPTQRIIFP